MPFHSENFDCLDLKEFLAFNMSSFIRKETYLFDQYYNIEIIYRIEKIVKL